LSHCFLPWYLSLSFSWFVSRAEQEKCLFTSESR
jgi:hypothetical protein